MGETKFQAILERPEGVGTWTYLAIPFDAVERYGSRGQIKVKGTINGQPFTSTLLPRGDGSHYLVVPRPIREKIGASRGAKVRVTLEADKEVRKVAVPKDLTAALRKRRGLPPHLRNCRRAIGRSTFPGSNRPRKTRRASAASPRPSR